MVWSHGVGKDGKVVGLELSEKFAGIAGKAFKDNGVENVDIKLGDAVESYVQSHSSLLYLPPPSDSTHRPEQTDDHLQPRHLRAIRALRPDLPRREQGRVPQVPGPDPLKVEAR